MSQFFSDHLTVADNELEGDFSYIIFGSNVSIHIHDDPAFSFSLFVTGQIPVELTQLSGLQRLDLSNNK